MQQTKEATVKNASDASVYDELETLVTEMREQGVMPGSEQDVYAHLNLYEDYAVNDPRYYVGVTIKRFF